MCSFQPDFPGEAGGARLVPGGLTGVERTGWLRFLGAPGPGGSRVSHSVASPPDEQRRQPASSAATGPGSERASSPHFPGLQGWRRSLLPTRRPEGSWRRAGVPALPARGSYRVWPGDHPLFTLKSVLVGRENCVVYRAKSGLLSGTIAGSPSQVATCCGRLRLGSGLWWPPRDRVAGGVI